jgi:RNA polymerase sigma factor (sigma-70 family)
MAYRRLSQCCPGSDCAFLQRLRVAAQSGNPNSRSIAWKLGCWRSGSIGGSVFRLGRGERLATFACGAQNSLQKKDSDAVPEAPRATLFSLESAARTAVNAMANPRRGFVEKLFAEHRGALQRYIYRRIRTKSDAPDLAQEVYARMLRVSDTEAIRNPQLYLYTVASNLVKEHAVREQRQAARPELDESSVEERLGDLPPLDSQLESTQLIEHLRAVLDQLPARWRTALIFQYRYGLTYQEIAERLGVSSNMVKKYLAQGLGHCRRQMAQWE